jgi:ABC-type uncharacterized transport system permease subunit
MNAPQDWVTTAGLIAATASAAAACAVALWRFKSPAAFGPGLLRGTTFAATLLSAAVFVYRALEVHQSWAPLQTHVDGLALLAALLGLTISYIQFTGRVRGLGLFALPTMAVLLLWGVCASWWTLRPFPIASVWLTAHLFSVYLGTLGVATAAAAGALWLFVDKQLRGKDHRARRLQRLGRLGDLESIEAAITGSAAAGFVLLTVGLVTGLIIVTGGSTRLGPGWWHSPKVVLAAAVWLIFAVVMHVRFIPTFRGRRAAVLSIVGFVLLIAAMGAAQTLPPLEMVYVPGAAPGGEGR